MVNAVVVEIMMWKFVSPWRALEAGQYAIEKMSRHQMFQDKPALEKRAAMGNGLDG